MKFDNKLIVSDLDGTFFDSNELIPDCNIDAVNYFKENGGLFTFATSRNEHTISPEFAKFANAPLICCNGAYIYDFDNKRRHNEICIAPGPAMTIIKTVLESFPLISVSISADDKFYIIGSPDYITKSRYDIPTEMYISASIDEIPTNDWYSIVFHGDSNQLDLVEKFINVSADSLYIICRSWPTMLEINNIRATKGNAAIELRHMCEAKLKCGSFTLYGIGDYGNDIDLLKKADFSACPSNALLPLREIADVTVCSNNDGAVAGLIEYIDSNV
ncbi:MAG: hypothetical protein E7635_03945 [Ruminococcaceae bacterium]|nr:hypothetical protein [Oscillospiraceae bacterium]